MNYNSTTWRETTQKIFYGVLIYSIAGFIYPAVNAIHSFTSTVSGIASMTGAGGMEFGGLKMFLYILQTAIIGGYVLYFMGLTSFVKISDENDAKAVGSVRTGAIIMIVATLVEMFLWGFVASIIYIVGFIIMMLGFSGMKKSSTLPKKAVSGASTLFISMILLIIGFVLGLIPLVGAVFSAILSIVAFIMNITGWAKIKNAAEELTV